MQGLDLRFWRGKRVVVTGHTGFKGSWLSLWLLDLGARVTGIALNPDTEPALFEQLGLAGELEHRILDIRDADALRDAISSVKPDVVFHLAAQPLVRRSYREPLVTWQSNVLGSVHLLEALRGAKQACALVLVTSDKVYENREWELGYRECDPLGGIDPYSASKAATEIAAASWRASFFGAGHPVRIATARAGNVIGGGDWAEERIVPDLVRALIAGRALRVRNPGAVRPWQHVLEPLGGYLVLAQRLYEAPEPRYQDAFNFGPGQECDRTVRELVTESLTHWPGRWEDGSGGDAPHEAGRLALSVDRARVRLGWHPRWGFARAVKETIDWYRHTQGLGNADLRELTIAGIRRYLDVEGGAPSI